MSKTSFTHQPNWFLKIFLSAIFLLAISIFLVYKGAEKIHNYYAGQIIFIKPSTTILIQKGDNFIKILNKLAKNNYIAINEREIMMLYFLNRLSPKKQRIYFTGEYQILQGGSLRDILTSIRSHNIIYHKITFQEGLMTAEILQQINNSPLLLGQAISDVPEGVLMPETYYYTYGENKSDLVKRMQKSMQDYLDNAWKSSINRPSALKNPYEALILASIIEKEASYLEEISLVSSVFINRLNKKMRLEASPTVLYALNKENVINNRPLYNRLPTLISLKLPSPHNTYLIKGLPPTPICNPGKEAIKAALNPADSNYLFFISSNDGHHIFSSDFKSHIKNRFKYNH